MLLTLLNSWTFGHCMCRVGLFPLFLHCQRVPTICQWMCANKKLSFELFYDNFLRAWSLRLVPHLHCCSFEFPSPRFRLTISAGSDTEWGCHTLTAICHTIIKPINFGQHLCSTRVALTATTQSGLIWATRKSRIFFSPYLCCCSCSSSSCCCWQLFEHSQQLAIFCAFYKCTLVLVECILVEFRATNVICLGN